MVNARNLLPFTTASAAVAVARAGGSLRGIGMPRSLRIAPLPDTKHSGFTQ